MIEQPPRTRGGLLVNLWRGFTTPSAHFSLGSILLYGFFAGIVFWGGFHWAMELSNTESFCVACHEMSEFVQPEVVKTRHYNNSSGIRATCADCHVPREWAHKIAKKADATLTELPAYITGTIMTRERYEARRLVMAEKVWDELQASDSLTCRNCHSLDHMNFASQEGIAARQHQLARERNVTCITCHKGVAHPLPPGAPDRALIVDRR